MKSRFTAVVLGALAVALLASVAVAAAATTKTSPFSATYAGRAVVRSTSDTTADINATGAGKGTVVGASKLVGIGAGFSGDPCSAFSGKGTITAKTGKLNFTLAPGAKACASASDENQYAVTASAKVTGGTLAYKKAKGAFKITGTYDRATGKFTTTFKGSITM